MLFSLWDTKTARVLFTILIFVMVLAFLRGARETLTLFLFAILFAYFVDPAVSFFQRKLNGRMKGIAVTYVLLIGLLVGIGFALGPRIAEESKGLTSSVPAFLDRIASGQIILSMGQSRGWTHERAVQIQQVFLSNRDAIKGYGEAALKGLEEPLSHIWWLILIPILSLFFLKDARTMAFQVVGLGGDAKNRSVLRGIVNDINVMLGSYIRAQLILAGLTAAVLTLVLGIMGAPFAFVLGPLAGVCEFIPVVGPAVASVAIFGIALLSGYPHLLWIFLFLGAWRLIQDYVSAPKIMGESLEISPLVQIFGVLAGGEIGGVVGALISVPILAVLRILWVRLRESRTDEGVAEASSGVSVSQGRT